MMLWMHITGSRAGSTKTTTGPSPLLVAETPKQAKVSLVQATADLRALMADALERCGSRVHAEADTRQLLVGAEEKGPIDLVLAEAVLPRPAMTGAQLATSELSDEQVRMLVRTLMGRKTN